MHQHLALMDELFNRVHTTGLDLQEVVRVAILLASLPKSYDGLVTALEARNEKDLRIDMVKSKLEDEFMKRNEDNMNCVHEDKLLKVKHGLRCFRCNKPGHFRKSCPELKSGRNGGGNSRRKSVQNASYAVSQNNNAVNNVHSLFVVANQSIKKCWYVDSGATMHMSSNRDVFEKMNTNERSVVSMADGECMDVMGSGNGILTTVVDGKAIRIGLEKILYVPDLQGNLLSVSTLTSKGLVVTFDSVGCRIEKDGIVWATAKKCGKLYVLDLAEETYIAYTENVHNINCLHTWHRRLGHRDIVALGKLEKRTLADGISIKDCGIKEVCECCLKGKQSRKPFPKESKRKTKGILELVHTDLCGPMPTKSHGGMRYIMTVIDDYSRYTTIYLLKEKSDVLGRIKEYVEQMENQFGIRLKKVRSDNGKEYVSGELLKFYKSKGILHQYTVPYTAQQNGVAERKNRSLVEMGRCLLLDGDLPNTFWGEAVNTANYILNRTPSTSVERTPYELWYGTRPDLSNMKVFGCKAYVHIPKEKRNKLSPKSKLCKFVGYCENQKGYRFYDVSTICGLIVSRDATFIELNNGSEDQVIEFTTKSSDNMENVHIKCTYESNDEEYGEPEGEDDGGASIQEETNVEKLNSKEPETEKNDTPRRSKREKKKPEKFTGYKVTSKIIEPKDYREAMASSDRRKWEMAMSDEYKSMVENKVWTLTELPAGKNLVGCKWIYKLKEDADGNVVRYKARLVAQGFSQKFGCDYDEVFAPVVTQTTFRILLALAHERKFNVHHFDVKTAFLNGDLDDEIYMRQPQGFEEENRKHLVCKLSKSLYGLKQAARSWNVKIHDILTKMGFVQSKNDCCMYTKSRDGSEPMYILIYVDDMIVACKNVHEISKFGEDLKRQIQITDLGPLKQFLGIRVCKDEQGYYCLDQSVYIKKVLEQFGYSDAKSSNIPMDSGYLSGQPTSPELPNNTKYRSLIGALMYIAVNTRPDIANSVSILCRKVEKPTQADWNEVVRVVRYLKGTADMKLKLGCDDVKFQDQLTLHVDADWAGDVHDRKSHSGYLFKFIGAPINWASRKQDCVSLSSTEAEYVALSDGCRVLLWIKRLLEDFGVKTCTPINVHEDNQSCIKLVLNDRTGRRSKHIDTKYNFVKDLSRSKKINLVYCPTDVMVADLLTKPLGRLKTNQLRSMMGLVDLAKGRNIEEEC